MDWGVLTFVFAIITVGILIFVAILLTGKRHHRFNIEDYQARFLAIENSLQKNHPTSFSISILEADKLLDRAMHEIGFPGKTMGERLKKSNNRFSNLNAIWQAHKLRNYIAHEPNFSVSFTQAQNALTIYKQALKDLGAI